MEEEGNTVQGKEFLKTILLSTSLFLITYFAVVFITGLSELYIAYDFDIPATLFLNGTQFHIPDTDALWTRDALTSILLATPVSSFVLGMGAVFLFMVCGSKTQTMLYVTIWLLLQSFNMTLGLISENLITQSGVARVAKLQGLGTSALIVITGMALYFMFQFGAFIARLLLAHGGISIRRHRYLGVVSFFFIPWFIGNSIILLFNYPNIGHKEIFIKIMMIVMLLPSFIIKMPEYEEIKKSPVHHLIAFIVVSFVVTWFSVMILRQGISF
jgi:hypothetical protein